MTERPREETQVHTRLLKCALEVEEARAFWAQADSGDQATPEQAFEGYWFGARSLPRIKVLLTNLRARFSAFPNALWVLHRWPAMSPSVRRSIAHWHLQLADPLYRAFSGDALVQRRQRHEPTITRDIVVKWVGDQGPGRWTMPTRIQFASKLLSAAYSAGLVCSRRDPRPVVVPRTEDEALEYALYLLREVEFEGGLLDNPYFRSVGLEGDFLESRLRSLEGLAFERQGDLVDFGWRFPDLASWANARFGFEPTSQSRLQVGGAS